MIHADKNKYFWQIFILAHIRNKLIIKNFKILGIYMLSFVVRQSVPDKVRHTCSITNHFFTQEAHTSRYLREMRLPQVSQVRPGDDVIFFLGRGHVGWQRSCSKVLKGCPPNKGLLIWRKKPSLNSEL